MASKVGVRKGVDRLGEAPHGEASLDAEGRGIWRGGGSAPLPHFVVCLSNLWEFWNQDLQSL